MKKQNFLRLLILLTLALAFTTQAVNAAPKTDKGRKNAAKSAELTLDRKQYTVEELKALANQYRSVRNNLGLVAVLKIWTEKEPRRFDIRLELGTIYISQNKLIDAAQVLNEASSIIPSDEAPHRLLAQIYKSQGDDSLRYLHLVKAASLAKRNWENQFNLGMYHAGRGQNKKAEAFLVNTMELRPGFAAAKFEYAKLMLEREEVESAFQKFGEALLIETENYVYMAFYAYAAALSGRATVSSDNIGDALKFAPKNSQVQWMAGLIHLNSGNISAAEKSLRAAHRYSPTDALVIESLGDALAADFKFKEACANYLTAWQTAGYSERIAFKLGKTLSLDKKYREARDFLESIAVKSSENGEALYYLTEVYCELNDMNRANALAHRIAGSKNAVWRQLAQGRIHEARSDSDFAHTAYLAAHIIAPNNALTSAALGRMLFKQGEIDSAIAFFEAAGALDPANINNIMDKARAYEKKGSRDEAVSIYESIIARSPQHPDIYQSIAAIKEEQGSLRGAIACLKRGLDANPGNANLLFRIGGLYLATDQYELAINTYQASLGRKVSEGNVEALRIIGEIYYTKLLDEKKAREYFKKYVRATGKSGDAEAFMKKLTMR